VNAEAVVASERESNVVPLRRNGETVLPTGLAATASETAATAVAALASAARAEKRRMAWLRENAFIAGIYLLDAMCIGLFAIPGTVHWTAGLVFAVPGLIVTAVIALLIAFKRTSGFKDPSLSNLHALCGALCCLLGMVLYPQISFAYALFLFSVFLSMTYRMTKRQANIAWAIVSVVVATLTIGLGHSLHIPSSSATEQALAWLCLTLILGRCVMLSLINMSNTMLLRTRGKQMAETLDQIERLANYDELTSVLNRRSLLHILRDETARTDRSGSPISVAIFDLDKFKSINDTLGHLAGDRALRLFAEATQALTRNTDRFGRYGGEEFLMIFTDTDIEKAEVAVERIRQGVAQVDWSVVAPNFKLTFSAGIASYRAGETQEQLLGRADAGLYGAKDAGRNCTRAG
jgi:diguanylate cyclase (GGDEF)-like protein